ncbi:MAG: hypothetical protein JKY68_06975, partial [Rhodospirillales bacterium]|nr:hypothetical protein [Rhodospirillales bacterium]
KGGVSLSGAEIGGQLSCTNATFENDKPEGFALDAQSLTVKGAVLLRNGFSAKGRVSLMGAKIDGQLDCDDATFVNENLLEFAFVLQNARVKGIFFWRPAEETTGNISFQHARTGPLMDNKAGWPKYGSLLLDGFEYSAFAPGAPQTAEERLDWLGRQPKIPKEFTPQPYEHLIKVFRQMGHTRDARDVGIAKHDDFRSNRCCANLGEWLWNGILSVTIAHGYKPWKALIWMLAIVFAGWLVFANAETRKAIHPSKERVLLDDRYFNSGGRWRPLDYPAFSAAWYSLDVFLPIVDLHQESYWLPGKTDGPVLWAWRYKIWLWVEILLGWFLTTIAVAGLTGLVKKD